MAQPDIGAGLREIVARSAQHNIDPLAVIAVARQEGLSGGVGDSGTSFGPFQLHWGGAYPAGGAGGAPRPGVSQQASQDWAWSKAGIDYAVDQIAKVAGGTIGTQTIYQIVYRFERPLDPSGEFQRAAAYYSELASRRSQILQDGQLAPGATAIVSTAGSGNAGEGGGFTGVRQGVASLAGATAQGAGDIAAPITGPIHTVEDAIKFLFSYRFLEIVGGLGLVAIGMVGLIREVGGPRIPLPGGADRLLDAAFAEGVQQGEVAAARERGRQSVRRTSEESSSSSRRRRMSSGAADFGEVPF